MPGMRMLAEMACAICQRDFYFDLPAGHGLLYPMLLEQKSGEVFDSTGVPWFSQWSGGTDTLSAPSFGYIVGFLFAAALVGRLAAGGFDRTPVRVVLTMVAGNLLIYAFGLPWLMASIHVGLAKGLDLGVTRFLPGDALKIALAAGLLPAAWAVVRHRKG